MKKQAASIRFLLLLTRAGREPAGELSIRRGFPKKLRHERAHMELLQSLETRLRQPELLERLSEQIAESSFERAWERVQLRIFAFSPAETRGYIRARARLVVEQAIQAAPGELSKSARTRLYGLAMDQLICRVVNQVHSAWARERRRQAA